LKDSSEGILLRLNITYHHF